MNKAISKLRTIRGGRGPLVALLIIVVAMPLISLWTSFQIRALSERITTVDNARLTLARALRYAQDEQSDVSAFLETGARQFVDQYHASHARARLLFAPLAVDFARAGLYEAIPQLTDFEHQHAAWDASIAQRLLRNPKDPLAPALAETGKRLFDRMRADAATIQAGAARHTAQASRSMLDVLILSGVIAIAWILIVGTFAILIERRAIKRETDLVVSLVEEREAVERLSDWRSRLLAMLAHDFKSQLAVVIGAAHLLEDFPQRRGDPELLGSVRSAGYTLAEMADNAILLARAQERRLVLQSSTFDLSDVVGSVVQRYGAQREFRVYSETPTAMVEGDRSYVTRVMDNIIGNAVKYSEHPVDVHIGADAQKVRVRVVDRGVGIAEDDLPHIFEEFWRSENLQWSKKGSGIGLFIVKQIMEAHNGSIRVESELGKGTMVTLRFPQALTAFANPPLEQGETAAPKEPIKTATS